LIFNEKRHAKAQIRLVTQWESSSLLVSIEDN